MDVGGIRTRGVRKGGVLTRRVNKARYNMDSL